MSTLTEQTRAWIYRVLTALVPLAVTYGAVNEAEAMLWLAAAAAVLGLGLAAGNTSTVTEAGQLDRTDNGPRPGDGAQP